MPDPRIPSQKDLLQLFTSNTIVLVKFQFGYIMSMMRANARILGAGLGPHCRAFSSTPRRLDNYAFIGLGQMVSLDAQQLYMLHRLIRSQGFQMAKNLQSKLSPRDTVRLFDINKSAAEQLAQEMRASKAGGAAVELAESAADAARHSVCSCPRHLAAFLFQPFI